MRHLRTAFAVMMLAIAAVSASALSPIPSSSTSTTKQTQKPTATVTIDSIQWRADLTRVYCRIIGKPHTADRIDGVEMSVPKRRYAADDIDGVDFKRYFQWEDENYINLEIDFPAVAAPHSPCSLTFFTAYGEIKASVGK